MISTLFYFSLWAAGVNWALFVLITFWKDLPALKEIAEFLKASTVRPGIANTETHTVVDPTKIAAATGSLAGAFKKAGPAPTAAAMAVLCVLVAAIAAGIDKL
jgi:hypothetical protein